MGGDRLWLGTEFVGGEMLGLGQSLWVGIGYGMGRGCDGFRDGSDLWVGIGNFR